MGTEQRLEADALGQILRALLTGKLPKLREVAKDAPPALASLVDRMLNHDRDERPRMASVVRALATEDLNPSNLRRVVLSVTNQQPGRSSPYFAVLSGWPQAGDTGSEAVLAKMATEAAALGPVTKLTCEAVETRRAWLRGG